MTPHDQVLQVANSAAAWIFCLLIVVLVFFQTFVFSKISLNYRKEFGVSSSEIKKAFKSGIITTVGPALSIFIVGLGLVARIGGPLTLARLSVIGNATFEASAAELGAAALGTSINSPDYNLIAYTCSVWVMGLGGSCMLIMPFLFTKSLTNISKKVINKRNLAKIIGISASLASFGYFSLDYAIKSNKNLVAVAAAFLTVLVVTKLGEKFKILWAKEWSLAFSIIISVIFVSMIS